LANLPGALEVADQAVVFDNSGPQPRKVLETRNGIITWCSMNEPEWIAPARRTMAAPRSAH